MSNFVQTLKPVSETIADVLPKDFQGSVDSFGQLGEDCVNVGTEP